MRRVIFLLIIILMMPQFPASANEDSFDFFIDEEVVIHPGETVPLRIAWHNLVGSERHFQISVNQTHSNLTIDEIYSMTDKMIEAHGDFLPEYN